MTSLNTPPYAVKPQKVQSEMPVIICISVLIRIIFRIQNIPLVEVQNRWFARKKLAIDVLLGQQ